jgi:hypothetical protein
MNPNQPIDSESNESFQLPTMRIFSFLKLICGIIILTLFIIFTPKDTSMWLFCLVGVLLLGVNLGAHLVGFGSGIRSALEYGYDKGLERGTELVMSNVTEKIQEHLNHLKGRIDKDTPGNKDVPSKQQRLDILLDKLFVKGIEGLTSQEKQELQELSKQDY